MTVGRDSLTSKDGSSWQRLGFVKGDMAGVEDGAGVKVEQAICLFAILISKKDAALSTWSKLAFALAFRHK